MRPDARCRSCNAAIRWVITAANGKRMPLDPDPVPDGNVWIDGMQDGVPLVQVALSGDGVPRSVPLRYVSHFVTCEHRDQWRKS